NYYGWDGNAEETPPPCSLMLLILLLFIFLYTTRFLSNLYKLNKSHEFYNHIALFDVCNFTMFTVSLIHFFTFISGFASYFSPSCILRANEKANQISLFTRFESNRKCVGLRAILFSFLIYLLEEGYFLWNDKRLPGPLSPAPVENVIYRTNTSYDLAYLYYSILQIL
ncbi:hypothetical protein L9F63_010671, partial [Diploptera punctata]